MAIVFALSDVADDLVKACVTPQMRQSYAAWVGLTVLQQLVRTKRFVWGDGALGDGHSFRSGGSNVQLSRGTKAARQARLQANLLLNQVHGDGIIPCLQDMNFPYEVAAARQALFGECFLRACWVPITKLAQKVCLRLCQLEGKPEQGDYVSSELALKHAVLVPGLSAKVTTSSIGLVVEYYGLGDWAPRRHANGYYLHWWKVHRLVELWHANDRRIQLAELDWMKGRYVVRGQPLEVAARGNAMYAPDGPAQPEKSG